MCDVQGFASRSYRACRVVVAAELDARSSVVSDDAGLDASVETAKHLCLEVRSLLA
jgi:hypothetical protein